MPQAQPAQPAPPAVVAPAQTPTQTPTPSSSSGVKSGMVLRPDTVEVGDPFRLVVTIQVPRGARIEWPSITDTAAVVAMRSPVRVSSVVDGTLRRESATYDLAAWDVGALDVALPPALVREGASTVPVPLTGARVFVRSVLPGDTTLHVPKPAKALFPRVVPWWERWWPALAVLLALALLWWLWRRRRTTATPRVTAPLDVFARAVHDFDRLDRLALADAGERGRAVALAIEILRTYLHARVPAAALSLTSAELLVATADDTRVPHERLLSLLGEADAIKFARRRVHDLRARELTGEARHIVEYVEHEERARLAREEAVRLARIKAEQDAKQNAEDDARRRSRRKAGAA